MALDAKDSSKDAMVVAYAFTQKANRVTLLTTIREKFAMVSLTVEEYLCMPMTTAMRDRFAMAYLTVQGCSYLPIMVAMWEASSTVNPKAEGHLHSLMAIAT
jgi:hypothetical protein